MEVKETVLVCKLYRQVFVLLSQIGSFNLDCTMQYRCRQAFKKWKNPARGETVGTNGEENEACSRCFCSLVVFEMKSWLKSCWQRIFLFHQVFVVVIAQLYVIYFHFKKEWYSTILYNRWMFLKTWNNYSIKELNLKYYAKRKEIKKCYIFINLIF